MAEMIGASPTLASCCRLPGPQGALFGDVRVAHARYDLNFTTLGHACAVAASWFISRWRLDSKLSCLFFLLVASSFVPLYGLYTTGPSVTGETLDAVVGESSQPSQRRHQWRPCWRLFGRRFGRIETLLPLQSWRAAGNHLGFAGPFLHGTHSDRR